MDANNRLWLVRMMRSLDGRGNPLVIYWTKCPEPLAEYGLGVEMTTLGEGRRFSWRRWWTLQKGILIDWAMSKLEGLR